MKITLLLLLFSIVLLIRLAELKPTFYYTGGDDSKPESKKSGGGGYGYSSSTYEKENKYGNYGKYDKSYELEECDKRAALQLLLRNEKLRCKRRFGRFCCQEIIILLESIDESKR